MPDEDKNQELYVCGGCAEEIPMQQARISCHSCPDYHLCANCFVIKQFNRPHIESHSTIVLKQSGFVVPLPPGFPPPPAPALPPRRNSTVNTRKTIRVLELPTANWGALWGMIKAPLDKKDKKKSGVGTSEKVDGPIATRRGTPDATDEAKEKGSRDSTPLSRNPINQFPPSQPKSVRQGIECFDSTAPSYPRPASWEPLFKVDSTTTPIFVAFMSTIFGHLDPTYTEFLSPKVYSNFLDLQGFELGSNFWKYALESDGGEQSKDVADLELSLYYAHLNISHTLKIRSKFSSPDDSVKKPTSAVEGRIKESMRISANMPMLSRQGFTDLGAIEYLRDPSKGHEYLKSIIKKYNIWTELGDIPRSALPESSIPKTLLAEKMEAEPENVVAKVLLAEKLVQEEEKLKESDSQGGYESEALRASPWLGAELPMKVNGGAKKVDALMNMESFDEGSAASTVGTENEENEDNVNDRDGVMSRRNGNAIQILESQ